MRARCLAGPAPVDVDAPQRLIRKLGECHWREVKVCKRTACAPVGDRDCYTLALVSSSDFLVADRVVVRVHAIIARVGVEQQMRDSSNVVRVGICDTTCSKTSLIECALASIDAAEEAARRTTAGCRGSLCSLTGSS